MSPLVPVLPTLSYVYVLLILEDETTAMGNIVVDIIDLVVGVGPKMNDTDAGLSGMKLRTEILHLSIIAIKETTEN